MVPAQVPHGYGTHQQPAWTIHWFHAAGGLVPFFLTELGMTIERPVFYLGEDARLLGLFEDVLGELEHGYAPVQLLYASQALGHLLAAIIASRQTNWRRAPDTRQKISHSIAYMKQHRRQPLQVATLAALANLSPSHYAALFKHQTGYAPIDDFIRLRMHHACQLLDTTSLTVKEVAAALGYDDAFYFSRLFKLVNNNAPSAYRLMRKG